MLQIVGITLGIQQYVLRDYINDENSALKLYRKLNEMGYESIELCQFLIEKSSYAASEALGPKNELDWKHILNAANLKVAGIHENFELIREDPEKYVKEATDFGTNTIVAAAALETDFRLRDSISKLVFELNQTGKILKDCGVHLLYHTHHMEYVHPTGDVNSGFYYLSEEVDPQYVGFEFDVYWAQMAGVNPEKEIARLGSRLAYVHLTDCTISEPPKGSYERESIPTELGMGNMDISSIVKMAQEAGCSSFISEQHGNWIDNSVLRSSQINAAFLKTVLCAETTSDL